MSIAIVEHTRPYSGSDEASIITNGIRTTPTTTQSRTRSRTRTLGHDYRNTSPEAGTAR